MAFGWHLGGTLNAGSQARGMEAGRSGRSEHLGELRQTGACDCGGRSLGCSWPWQKREGVVSLSGRLAAGVSHLVERLFETMRMKTDKDSKFALQS